MPERPLGLPHLVGQPVQPLCHWGLAQPHVSAQPPPDPFGQVLHPQGQLPLLHFPERLAQLSRGRPFAGREFAHGLLHVLLQALEFFGHLLLFLRQPVHFLRVSRLRLSLTPRSGDSGVVPVKFTKLFGELALFGGQSFGAPAQIRKLLAGFLPPEAAQQLAGLAQAFGRPARVGLAEPAIPVTRGGTPHVLGGAAEAFQRLFEPGAAILLSRRAAALAAALPTLEAAGRLPRRVRPRQFLQPPLQAFGLAAQQFLLPSLLEGLAGGLLAPGQFLLPPGQLGELFESLVDLAGALLARRHLLPCLVLILFRVQLQVKQVFQVTAQVAAATASPAAAAGHLDAPENRLGAQQVL